VVAFGRIVLLGLFADREMQPDHSFHRLGEQTAGATWDVALMRQGVVEAESASV